MVLQMWREARKAEIDGNLPSNDELPPPSHGLGLPTFRAPTHQELNAQPPPKVADERYACMNMTCLCSHIGGVLAASDQCSSHHIAAQTNQFDGATATNGKALRMEYRMLSDDQRARFHAAMQQLKRGFGSYEYDRLSALHSDPRMMPSAHSGPTFLLWHREYLKRLEIALRAIDPTVAIPYWDSSLDGRLPNPLDSVMWSSMFMGTTNDFGQIVNGEFANWITISGTLIQRTPDADGQLMKEEDIDALLSSPNLEHIFSFPDRPVNGGCTLPNLNPANMIEIIHSDVHTWVGGDMLALNTAAQDPLFFLHHSFMDLIWEQWRLKWQSRAQRETQFPPDSQIVPCSGSEYYRLNAIMRPFQDPVVLNKDGLSNAYTDNLYTYAPRPSCNGAGQCGSSYLFCDTTKGKPLCCAKIMPGGDCSIFISNSEEPCYSSSCINGVCQNSISFFSTLPLNIVYNLDTTTPSPTPRPPSGRFCYDSHECCTQWATRGACWTAPRYMNTWCPCSCQFDGCQPHPDEWSQYQQDPTGQICKDRHSQCERWANFHKTRHASHVSVHHIFNRWHTSNYPRNLMPKYNVSSSNGECARNAHWMTQNCAKSCGHCRTAIGTSRKCSLTMPKDYEIPIIH
ncbi:hypothetical protein niasHT_010938 [Heterodera trifolii]|uniref:ShKT domain-containing protein n=1 Tax=Heterodera trifolii TaxID=157864 RepID=A0ABD2LG15_9BILA